MPTGKLITGIILIIIGIPLMINPFLGIACIAIGIMFIVFRNDENKIEQRKDLKGGKK